MTKRFFYFFKEIFTNKLFASLSIIFLYLLPEVKLHPFLSESLVDIIAIYLLIYFFLPLFNFFKKDSFLLNGLIFIVGFLFLIEILKILPDENGFIYNLIAIFFFHLLPHLSRVLFLKYFCFFQKEKRY